MEATLGLFALATEAKSLQLPADEGGDHAGYGIVSCGWAGASPAVNRSTTATAANHTSGVTKGTADEPETAADTPRIAIHEHAERVSCAGGEHILHNPCSAHRHILLQQPEICTPRTQPVS